MHLRFRKLSVAFLVTPSLLTVTAATRADFVDQSQLDDSVYIAAFGQTDLAQSFQQADPFITGAQIELQYNAGEGETGDITISLYDALPNNGGTQLASGTALGVLAGDFATVGFGERGALVICIFGGAALPPLRTSV